MGARPAGAAGPVAPAAPVGPYVIGIETGGEHLGVALGVVHGVVGAARVELLGEMVMHRGRRHADVVLAFIDTLLTQQDLAPRDIGLVAVGRGPGSFTGIRVGLATALGLAAGGAPATPATTVWPVSSLAGLAQHAGLRTRAAGGTLALVMLDARRGEVYGGLYRAFADHPPEVLLAPRAGTCEAVLAAAGVAREHAFRQVAPTERDWLCFGSGAVQNQVASPVPDDFHIASARELARLAVWEWDAAGRDAARAPALDAAYLRASEAERAADARDQAAAQAATNPESD